MTQAILETDPQFRGVRGLGERSGLRSLAKLLLAEEFRLSTFKEIKTAFIEREQLRRLARATKSPFVDPVPPIYHELDKQEASPNNPPSKLGEYASDILYRARKRLKKGTIKLPSANRAPPIPFADAKPQKIEFKRDTNAITLKDWLHARWVISQALANDRRHP